MNPQNEPSGAAAPDVDTGLQCLVGMAQMHQIPADEARLRHELGDRPLGRREILQGAALLGMKARAVRQPASRLQQAPLPAVAQSQDGRYFIVGRVGVGGQPDIDPSGALSDPQAQHKVLIQHVGEQPVLMGMEEFLQHWTGELILFTSKATYAGSMARFDFSWFIPAVIRYRRMLLEVLLLSFVLQIIGLTTPLFFQVVMDKVLVNNAMQTLNVISVGLLAAILFEAIMGAIRSWVFAHTSSKIDAELGARLFRHLLSLPLAYFQARRVGDSVARVRELEHIREFLTNNSITLVLDLLFSFVFIGVMFFYSTTLTWMVIFSIPCYFILSLVFTPLIRNALEDKFNRGAENQAFLVESVTGVDTLKAMAVEPRWHERWDRQLASYIESGMRVARLGILASGGVQLIGKLLQVLIMWHGVHLVVENKLTVGELIAFNMLAQQVATPILRLAQLWNDFQQVGISMARLGDILNSLSEIHGHKSRLPTLQGSITLEKVSFRYRPDAAEVLRDIDLTIRPGEVIGIVGRSGSGKSTLTKIIQRLYTVDRGRVLIDGNDISVIDTTSLRQQIGVVLQENHLFNRTVRENIALSRPAARLEEIVEVARLAGAHDFIGEMVEGYDTVLGEHGVGLSGGQRQRVAIARALMSNPRVLIFDEATSALDYESERIIQQNMKAICRGRTVLIIAHRLSAVRHADRILVMEKGQIVEQGKHEELITIPKGIYAHLYRLQQGEGA